MAEPITVVLIDDHPMVRQGLKSFVDVQEDMSVVGEAEDGAAGLETIERQRPDVVLLDLKMPGMDGHEVLRELAKRDISPRVIVLTSVTESAAVRPALIAGAAGFLYKDIDPDALAQAIRSVHDGQMLFAPEAAGAMMAPEPYRVPEHRDPGLTDRERQVLRLVAVGKSNREIARELSVAEKTVKTHMSSVLRKLGVADRTQAALYAVRHGLGGD